MLLCGCFSLSAAADLKVARTARSATTNLIMTRVGDDSYFRIFVFSYFDIFEFSSFRVFLFNIDHCFFYIPVLPLFVIAYVLNEPHRPIPFTDSPKVVSPRLFFPRHGPVQDIHVFFATGRRGIIAHLDSMRL